MGRLVSVNVGLPKDVPWHGQDGLHGRLQGAGDRASPGRQAQRRGDGQGDLAGHGGEQRAVFVYQLDSYRHWERELERDDFVHGQFGENFTIEGLGDDEVCIGDRYRIGSATFEVTQPRVTCYRVGIRMEDPRIPALLVSHHRPGFYFRVLEEGEVQAGDEILKLATGPEEMTVAEVSALLYLPGHPRQQLLRALRIPALSVGWQASFRALLDAERRAWQRGTERRRVRLRRGPASVDSTVTAVEHESDSVISIRFEDPDGKPLPAARPGQYLTLRIQPDDAARPLLRNYSLSGPPDAGYYRIAVKREHDGAASGYLHSRLAVGDQLDVAAPRGTFILDESDDPVLLISAGIGATPVLAMLNALAEQHSARQIWWLHGARNGHEHSFAAETRALLAACPNTRAPHLLQPAQAPTTGKVATSTRRGASPPSLLLELEPPRDARGVHLRPDALHERSQRRPGRRSASTPRGSTPSRSDPNRARRPASQQHRPELRTCLPAHSGDGPTIEFARSNLSVPWSERLRQPPRARRSLRRAGPLVLPDRRLPHLRDDPDRRRPRLRPRSSGAAGRRERAHLLLTPTRRCGARAMSTRCDLSLSPR